LFTAPLSLKMPVFADEDPFAAPLSLKMAVFADGGQDRSANLSVLNQGNGD